MEIGRPGRGARLARPVDCVVAGIRKMANLIILIISIGLLAAIAAAGFWWGGDAFTEGSAKANASGLISSGSQIQGASELYALDNAGSLPTSINALTSATPSYLEDIPDAPTGSFGINTTAVGTSEPFATASGQGGIVCSKVNEEAGNSTGTSAPGMTSNAPRYGCTSGDTFFYKL